MGSACPKCPGFDPQDDSPVACENHAEPETKPREPMEVSHLEAVRVLSGIFRDGNAEMQTRLVLCNLISRNALGDAADDFTDEWLLKVGLKLKREKTS